MKKILTLLITTIMLVSMVPLMGMQSAKAASINKPATMIANRWQKIGYDRYGRGLPDNKIVPWQKSGQQIWGRPDAGFPMPFALRAVHQEPNSIPIPPATPLYSLPAAGTSAVSEIELRNEGLWTEVWLTVIPDAGNSQYKISDHWYVIMDGWGQVWFDPDGIFNDPRYFGYADPYNVNYRNAPFGLGWDNCQDNPKALVDPIVSNNTQGPYIFDPDYNPFANPNTAGIWRYHSDSYALNNQAAPVYNPRIYFWDAMRTKRLWKLGWADMADYYAFSDPQFPNAHRGPAGARPTGIVHETGNDKSFADWDVGLTLSNFVPTLDLQPPEHALNGSVLHTENISHAYPDTYLAPIAAHTPSYQYGEYIYQKAGLTGVYPPNGTGYGRYLSFVDQGDLRLTGITVMRNSDNVVYPANTNVIDNGIVGLYEPGDDWDVGASLWAFANTALDPIFPSNERYHDQVISGITNNRYDWREFIYIDVNNDLLVNNPDIRITDVNGFQDNINNHYPDRPDLLFDTDGMKRAGVAEGDLLLMAEVLDGGCLAPTYDIAVESDAWIGWWDNGNWMGITPALTGASIRSEFDTTINHFERVQKDAVLGEKAIDFFVPACVFQNIHLEERQFAGWSIWLDDGIDNSRAANINSAGFVKALDLSQDVQLDETIEQTVGTESLQRWDKDYSRGGTRDLKGHIVAFSSGQVVGPRYGYYDTNANGYGCGEHIYRDNDMNTNLLGNTTLTADGNIGDTTLNVVTTAGFGIGDTIVVEGNVAGEDETFLVVNIPNATQVDISGPLSFFHTLGRAVYELGGAGTVSRGDLRLTAVTAYRNQTLAHYEAGSVVADGDLDIGEPLTYFAPTGGMDYFFYDIQHPESGIPFNNQYDPGEDIYYMPVANREVDFRAVRLTEVMIMGTTYACGTRVQLGMLLWHDNPINMISTGHNGLSYYMDFEVLPGQLQVNTKVDQPFMVEQTSHVTVDINPAPVRDNDKYYVLLENLPRTAYNNIAEVFRVIDKEHPFANFEVTPYRGSCDLTGFVQDRKIYIHVFKEEIGLHRTAYAGLLDLPTDGPYFDPYWKNVYRDPEKRAYANFARNVFDPVYDFRYHIYEPLLGKLAGSYDCYGLWDSTVQPERLDISANRQCLTVLEQRFPNIVLTLKDWDNPNDVNDPAGIPFAMQSIPDRPHRVNYNARGAGVKFLFTASNPTFTEKYIVQVNDDDTFICWLWYDFEPLNMLSPLDYLYYRPLGHAFIPDPRVDRDALNHPPRLPTDSEPESELQKASVNDIDCSGKQATCDICGEEQGFLPIGSVTLNDVYSNAYFSMTIQTYGVPTMVTDYGFLNRTDPGGQMLVVVLPRNADSNLWIRVVSDQTIFNYNSNNGQLWPPNDAAFLRDETGGADYCGVYSFKVTPPDPDVNFCEMTMVDHALQYSRANYTAGVGNDGYHTDALHRLNQPAPQIQTPYNPILYDYNTEIRCYPGGQTHPTRLSGPNSKRRSGWNAYPAIHAKQFYKLGTEFFPLTDYGLFFVLKNQRGEHLSFATVQDWNPPYPVRYDLQIKRITMEGPFMRPRFMNQSQDNFLANNYYNGTEYLPIQYDFSGQLIIDETNYLSFANRATTFFGGDFRNVTSPYMTNANPKQNSIRYPSAARGIAGSLDADGVPENTYLTLLDRSLDYTAQHWANLGAMRPAGDNDLFIVDEIIPINYGNIKITVEMYSGKKKIYQDCCIDPPVDGLNVHGLDIQGAPKQLEVDQDNVIEVSLKEYSDIQVVQECNNALAFCWQDRGIKTFDGNNMRVGIGDGWITNPPRNSNRLDTGWQYLAGDDINGDGKIKFNDFETEILGTYDMVTNAWLAGVIDARTYQRQDGMYKFELTKDEGCQLDEVGYDFGGGSVIGGRFSVQDHVIGVNEELPVYITAYKYGDDDNDRSFQPYYEIPPETLFGRAGFSHEVYLAAQAAVKVVGREDLVVNTIPTVLTAGVTPEYVDGVPLTFQVLGPNGVDPINFFEVGVPDIAGNYKITSENFIASNLIDDPHPDDPETFGKFAELPQYYWLRTDLHNNDGSPYCNNTMFSSSTNPFNPIALDFSGAADGKYAFRGFCANDEGSFNVYFWTPDRKHRAKVEVKVRPPKVQYEIVNVDDPDLRVFSIPSTTGDADFLLTAADNRLYKIKVTCKSQDDKLLTGAAKGVSVCSGTDKDVARFTPTFSRPASFRIGETPMWSVGVRPDRIASDPTPNDVYQYFEPRFHPRFGIDKNANGKLDFTNNEIVPAKYFRYSTRYIYYYNYYGWSWFYYYPADELDPPWDLAVGLPNPLMYYRTENYAVKDPRTNGLKYSIFIYSDIYADPETTTGWGPGAIYNSYKKGGYVFADFTPDRLLTFADALSLDDKASTEFYAYAEDVCSLGGLIGDNLWSNSMAWGDVYGGINAYLSGMTGFTSYYFYGPTTGFMGDDYAPRTMKRRFGYRLNVANRNAFIPASDDTFFLDWDSFTANDNYLQIKAPIVEARSATTRQTLETKLMLPENYDIIYGKVNHLLFTFTPADPRDLPISVGGRVYGFQVDGGGVHENFIYARTERSETNPKAADAIMSVTPTGVDYNVFSLGYRMANTRFTFPYEYRISTDLDNKPIMRSFDSVRGLEVIVESDEPLRAQILGTLNIKVREYGTKAPAANAELKIDGAGVALPSKRCNDKGEATVYVTPTETGVIIVKATLAGYADGEGYITVGLDTQPPTLEIESPADYVTVNTATVQIKGTTKPGSTVTVNGQKVGVDIKGAWQANVSLQDGANTITVKATSPTGASTTRFLTVIRDTTPPLVLVNQPTGIISGVTTYEISGRVEPGCKVTVNSQPATVVFDVWTYTLNVVPGQNKFTVDATDRAGNKTVLTPAPITVYNKSTLEVVLGNTVANANGTTVNLLAPPERSATNQIMVDVQALIQAFGGQVNLPGNTINITLGSVVLDLTVNSNIGSLNNTPITLPESPVRRGTAVLVPAEYVMMLLQEQFTGMPAIEIQFSPQANRLTITRYWY